jgi:ribosome-binding factor A
VSDLLLEEIGLLARELSDPCLADITVTDVEVTADLGHAHVFVGQVGEDHPPDEVMKALERAIGFIRGELAERGVLRFVPNLSFHWDASADRGQRIDELLRQIGLA